MIVSGAASTQTSDLTLNGTSSRKTSQQTRAFLLHSWCSERLSSDSHTQVPHVSLVSPATHKVSVECGFFALESRHRVQRGTALFTTLEEETEWGWDRSQGHQVPSGSCGQGDLANPEVGTLLPRWLCPLRWFSLFSIPRLFWKLAAMGTESLEGPGLFFLLPPPPFLLL